MKRDVITFDEEKCNGCGLCVPNCPEGAIQIINGKARLVSDLFCDGLGACIGNCPQGAIKIEHREAEPYDEEKVIKNIVKAGPDTVAAHLRHLREHNQTEYLDLAVAWLKKHKIAYDEQAASSEQPAACGCPGSMARDLRPAAPGTADDKDAKVHSQLQQWPVQLHLLNPRAPYFKNADLVVAADCVPFAFADFHRRFLKGKILVIFCPKLDQSNEAYTEKLAEIFKLNDVKSVSIVHMEVPCCFGTESIVSEAVRKSGKHIVLKEYTVSINGEIV